MTRLTPAFIVQSFGFDAYQATLYNAVPGAIAIIANILGAVIVMYCRRKFVVLIAVVLIAVTGFVALLVLPRTPEVAGSLLAVYYVLQVYGACTSIIFYWSIANVAGHTKKACMTGMLYVGLGIGNIVGPQVYLTVEGEPSAILSLPRSSAAPYYRTGLIACISALCFLVLIILLQTYYLHHLNQRNVIRRRDRGKTGDLIDMSLEPPSAWAGLRARQVAQDEAEGKDPQLQPGVLGYDRFGK